MKALAVAGAGVLLCAGVIFLARAGNDDDIRGVQETVLYVWAGDQARTNPDFLSVIDFDEHSQHYGGVIATVPLPNPGATGNEPHHVGLSADGKVLGAGGLLSVLKGQKEVFFFDVSNPRAPKFVSSADPPLSSTRTNSMRCRRADSW